MKNYIGIATITGLIGIIIGTYVELSEYQQKLLNESKIWLSDNFTFIITIMVIILLVLITIGLYRKILNRHF